MTGALVTASGALASAPTTRILPALGTTAVVAVARAEQADQALAVLEDEVAAIDRACSRFRPDSEIMGLADARGRPQPVSSLCFSAVTVALQAAEKTGGAVDPTVGVALSTWGYDRDFALVRSRTSHPSVDRPHPARHAAARQLIGWWQVDVDARRRTVRVPAGVVLDLGATAKALAADRAAARIADVTGCGVVINLGGDIAVAGAAPEGGWAVGIAAMSSAPMHAVQQVVAIDGGGLASSSPFARWWSSGEALAHHVIDPATGAPAPLCWSLVSAVGASCVEANTATTAALVWGTDAPDRLRGLGQPGRLVDLQGRVTTVHGWPPDGPGARTTTSTGPAARPAGGPRPPAGPSGRGGAVPDDQPVAS